LQPQEYDALERVEREHWFYKGKRMLVRWWINRATALHPGDRILDVGAGNGELVRELGGEYSHKGIDVLGIEYSEEGRRLARERKGTDLLAGSILDIPLLDETCAVSIALDVLEHVEDDATAFCELVRVTKPGGVVIINVPAFMSLWSEWDVSLAHFRRYRKRDMQLLIDRHSREVGVLYFDYINALVFPAVFAYRMLARLLKFKTRAEDRIPSARTNKFMLDLFVGSAKKQWFHPPFGVSLWLVLKKK
jgi:SAM-dependent methyltransferase